MPTEVAEALAKRRKDTDPDELQRASLDAQETLRRLDAKNGDAEKQENTYLAWEWQLKQLQANARNGRDEYKLNFLLQIAKLTSEKDTSIDKNFIDDALNHSNLLINQGNTEATRAFETIVFNQRASGKHVGKDAINKSIESLRHAAQQGNINAQYMFASLVLDKTCVARKRVDIDISLGCAYYELDEAHKDIFLDSITFNLAAAEKGHCGAQELMGIIHENGVIGKNGNCIIEQSNSEALRWYCKAAEQASTSALEKIKAICYKIEKKSTINDRPSSI
jgi:TPR repeat protein